MKKLTIWVSNSNGVNFNQRKNQSAARIYAVSNSNGVNFNEVSVFSWAGIRVFQTPTE